MIHLHRYYEQNRVVRLPMRPEPEPLEQRRQLVQSQQEQDRYIRDRWPHKHDKWC